MSTVFKCKNILSQINKATLFYFDNITVPEHVLSQLYFSHYRITPFLTVQETNNFIEVEYGVGKNEMHAD